MVDISVENYKNSAVYMTPIPNEELFWVRMTDVQIKLSVKNMSDLVRKEIHGILETKNPTKEQIKKYKTSGKELDEKSNLRLKYVGSDLMSKMIKHCRGVKK